MVPGFFPVVPGGRWVHPGSLGSLGFTLAFFGIILGRWGHSGSPRCRWVCGVHSVTRVFIRALVNVAGFIRVRMGSCRGSPRSLGFARVHSGPAWRRRVHSGSRGFTSAQLGVVGIILF